MSDPRQLGRYEIQGLLGRGGMGAVYKAHDPVLDRTVALKVISPIQGGSADAAESLERFRREARAAGRLAHPNIVSVHDLDRDSATDTPFIVMEYVDGVSLATVLAENPTLPLPQALEIVEQVALALEEAHRHRIIHRDIKPGNVFLDQRGRVKVGDFGIARLEGSELTQSGVGLGTPGYLAPEVVRGGPADARSDVFALGVLAYQLLTGKRPFPGATREALAVEIVEHAPEPPSVVRPEIRAHVSAAVMRALAKSPEARTPSATTFLRELREGPAPATVAIVGAAGRPRSRVAAAVFGIALLGLLGVCLAMRGCFTGPGPAAPRAATPKPRAETPTSVRTAAPTRPPLASAGESGGRGDDALNDARWREQERPREGEDSERGDKKDKGRGHGHGKGHGKH
jgi:hypothetical protein